MLINRGGYIRGRLEPELKKKNGLKRAVVAHVTHYYVYLLVIKLEIIIRKAIGKFISRRGITRSIVRSFKPAIWAYNRKGLLAPVYGSLMWRDSD